MVAMSFPSRNGVMQWQCCPGLMPASPSLSPSFTSSRCGGVEMRSGHIWEQGANVTVIRELLRGRRCRSLPPNTPEYGPICVRQCLEGGNDSDSRKHAEPDSARLYISNVRPGLDQGDHRSPALKVLRQPLTQRRHAITAVRELGKCDNNAFNIFSAVDIHPSAATRCLSI